MTKSIDQLHSSPSVKPTCLLELLPAHMPSLKIYWFIDSGEDVHANFNQLIISLILIVTAKSMGKSNNLLYSATQ